MPKRSTRGKVEGGAEKRRRKLGDDIMYTREMNRSKTHKNDSFIAIPHFDRAKYPMGCEMHFHQTIDSTISTDYFRKERANFQFEMHKAIEEICPIEQKANAETQYGKKRLCKQMYKQRTQSLSTIHSMKAFGVDKNGE